MTYIHTLNTTNVQNNNYEAAQLETGLSLGIYNTQLCVRDIYISTWNFIQGK